MGYMQRKGGHGLTRHFFRGGRGVSFLGCNIFSLQKEEGKREGPEGITRGGGGRREGSEVTTRG